MKNNRKLFEAELEFTRAYKEHINDDKAIREAYCVLTQMKYTVAPMRDNDYFVGRYISNRVGLYPLIIGVERVFDGYDKCLYSADINACREILEEIKSSGEYSDEYIKEVEEAIDFWEKEETYRHIKDAFTQEMKDNLADDYYHTAIGAVYPLYRIAGAHIDYKKLIRLGLNGLIEEVKKQGDKPLYEAMVLVLEGVKDVFRDYLAYVNELTPKDDNHKNRLDLIKSSLSHIIDKAPETLHQAMQLCNIYAVLASTTEIARMDDYLGTLYIADLENGIITNEDALNYVENYFDLFDTNFRRDTRCIIGGKGREDEESADAFCHVVLNVLDKKPILYPQVSLRYYKDMDKEVFDHALDVLGKGNTFPILYNDDVNVAGTMRAMDVPMKVAEQYAFFGCGEYMLANKSIGTPNTCLNMPKVLELVLNAGIDPVTNERLGLEMPEITEETTFEELFENYKKNIDYFTKICGQVQELIYNKCNEQGSFLLLSILHDDCIKRGKAIFDGGLYHNGGTVETYGNITVSDSFTAIKKVIFEDKKATLPELVKALNANFEGYEELRIALDNAPKYGNDNDYADDMAILVHEHVCQSIRNQKNNTNLDSLLIVMINNNMNVLLGKTVGATPDGRLSRVYLSNGNAAYPGKDVEGITALLNSLTKLDVSIHAGANCNLKFSKELFNKQREKLKMILETYFENGGQHGNISVVNQKDLEDALVHPEKYPNLMVRVGGFTARYVTLDHDTQIEILNRTAY